MRKIKAGEIFCGIQEIGEGKREVTVWSSNEAEYFPREKSIITDYEPEFIEAIFGIKGKYTCDELHREETSIPHRLGRINDVYNLNSDDRELDILDFGSGASSSTLALASIFKYNKITCVELEDTSINLAKERVSHHKLKNIEFIRPEDPKELGAAVKDSRYDLCVLSAVIEHMLPEERSNLLPKLWDIIRPGGYMIIYETPHRWFPMEVHTTSLPFINYLPEFLAWRIGSFLTKKNAHRRNKYGMLRAGLRGTSQREMRKYLGVEAKLIQPNAPGVHDIIDMWHVSDYHTSPRKELTYKVCRVIKKIFGIEITPWVTYVYKKPIYHTKKI